MRWMVNNVLNCRAVIAIVRVAFISIVVPVATAQESSPMDVGLSLLLHGNAAEAIPHLQQAAAMDPDNLAVQNGLGMAFVQTGRAVEALSAFRKALEISPDDSRVWVNIGLTYFYNRRYDDAIAAFQRGIRSDSQNAVAHEGLGNTYLSLNQAEKAIASLTTAVSLQPDYIQALANLAAACNLGGRHEEAVVAARRALALNVNLAPAHYSLGLAYGHLGHGSGVKVEQDWLAANSPEIAGQLQAKLDQIAPSHRIITPTDTPRENFVKTEKPADSINLLGVTVSKPIPGLTAEQWQAQEAKKKRRAANSAKGK